MNQMTSYSVSLDRRPNTVIRYRPQTAFKSPRQRLQKLKKQAIQAKQYFQSVLSSKIKAQQSLQKTKREQNHIKYNFIKLYQTKKGRSDKNKWHEKVQKQSQLSHRSMREKAKSQKLHSEFDKLLRENQEDQRKNYLSSKLNQQKKKMGEKLSLSRKKQQLMAKNSHDIIRDAKTSMSMKKRRAQNLILQNSKWNYISKMTKQAKLLKEYEVLAHQVENMNKQIGMGQNELQIFSGQFLITGISKNL